jgi:hypothetical protein
VAASPPLSRVGPLDYRFLDTAAIGVEPLGVESDGGIVMTALPAAAPSLSRAEYFRCHLEYFPCDVEFFSLLTAAEFPCRLGIHRLFAWRGMRFRSRSGPLRLLDASRRAPIAEVAAVRESDKFSFR